MFGGTPCRTHRMIPNVSILSFPFAKAKGNDKKRCRISVNKMRQFSINLFREKNEQNFATQEVQHFPPKRKSNFFGKQINAKKREVSHFPSTKAMQKKISRKDLQFYWKP